MLPCVCARVCACACAWCTVGCRKSSVPCCRHHTSDSNTRAPKEEEERQGGERAREEKIRWPSHKHPQGSRARYSHSPCSDSHVDVVDVTCTLDVTRCREHGQGNEPAESKRRAAIDALMIVIVLTLRRGPMPSQGHAGGTHRALLRL